jgi:LacI family transcriptional regulator
MTTQIDVAKKAGVSSITVSRVVNGMGNVTEKTRIRIQKAIEELGYYPNSQGRALKGGRTAIIGVIAPVLGLGSRSLEGDLYYAGLLEGVELACRKHHYDMLLSTQGIYDHDFDYLRLYSQKKVDGSLLFGVYMLSEKETARIERERIPIVVVGDRPENQSISWVDTDNEKAGFQSAVKLITMGHRRIAFIGIKRPNRNIGDRLVGVRRAMKANRLPFFDEDLFMMDQTTDPGQSIVDDLISRKERPTAIICGTDRVAIGLLNAARERSIGVPRDLSIVGFDGIQMIRHTTPPLTSNRQPLSEMGFAAAEILLRSIENPKVPSERRIFSLEEIPGASIAPPRSSKKAL